MPAILSGPVRGHRNADHTFDGQPRTSCVEEFGSELANSGVIAGDGDMGATVGLRGRLAALDDLLVPRLSAAGEGVALDDRDQDQLTDLELHGARDRYRRGLPPGSRAEARVHLAHVTHDRSVFRRRARTMAVFSLLVFAPFLAVGVVGNTWSFPLGAAVPVLVVPWAVGCNTAVGLRRRHDRALAALRRGATS